MNESLKKVTGSLSGFWKNASMTKKLILVAIGVAAVVAIIATAKISRGSTGVPLFDTPIKDENLRAAMITRINEEGINAFEDSDGKIFVDSKEIARKMRTTLGIEGLTPGNVDVFGDFYNRPWSTTDMEQNVKLQNAITKSIARHIESLDGVMTANVTLTLPDDKIFKDPEDKVKASVILYVNSKKNDILENKKKIKGLQSLILAAVPRLKAEDLVISDSEANILNDFEGMAESDRLSNINKQLKIRHAEEMQKKVAVLKAIKGILGEAQVSDLNINIDFDMSEETIDSTVYSAITKKPDNPNTPYDDSEVVDTLPISEQTVEKEWQGTGYNPQGPAGVEGQTPPTYSDMSNVIGKNVEKATTKNNAVNTTRSQKKTSPQTGRTTLSFNADGLWVIPKDPKTGKFLRKTAEEIAAEKPGDPGYGLLLKWQYIPVSDANIKQLEELAKGAIGFNQLRGDTVTVTSIQVNNRETQEATEEKYFKDEANKRTLIIVLVVVAVVLVGFVMFRMISKEMERRRRIREEELLRQQQAERERALWEARENTDNQVTMSVEDSRRAELQETAINLAKEHPEDVAMLIRTWLMEE